MQKLLLPVPNNVPLAKRQLAGCQRCGSDSSYGAVQRAGQARLHVLEVGSRFRTMHPVGLPHADVDRGALAGEFATGERLCFSFRGPGCRKFSICLLSLATLRTAREAVIAGFGGPGSLLSLRAAWIASSWTVVAGPVGWTVQAQALGGRDGCQKVPQ